MKVLFFILTFCLPSYVNCQCNFQDQMDRPPEELNRRRLTDTHDNKVPGFKYGHPYTMFVKGDDFNLTVTIKKIRDNIQLGQPFKINSKTNTNDYANLYKQIWDETNEANIDQPFSCNDADACQHPSWVKNNALIYLIGLKAITVGTNFHFDTLSDSDRNAFAFNANEGLKNILPVVTSCNGGADCGLLRRRAFQLIQYLQAYDILKTGGYISSDINRLKCNPRNRLREFTRNIYVESNYIINSNTGWKKNHGIICASALGMAHWF